MNVVMAGHVDHGKSTVIGRLLADTGSLPSGKLEQVKEHCARNARPFEYAFLLDALKDEQAQGITIETARCFFKTSKRDYILIDAPGHVEFLKNMVTGAARADAALLVIDAREGVQENSKRHGYLLSMLGIRQLVVLINKMDLVGFAADRFDAIRRQYGEFLGRIGIQPVEYVPISARDGINLTLKAPGYSGPTVLELLDSFRKDDLRLERPFRMPVQDVYKFTERSDDRRMIVGTVESGRVQSGAPVVFQPSGKKTKVATIQEFNRPQPSERIAGQAAAFTLADELYVQRGEMLCVEGEPPPEVGTRFRVTLFWMGKIPLVKGKRYKLKIGAAQVAAYLAEIRYVLDASDLSSFDSKLQIERHEVAECVLETTRPVAFDIASRLEWTSRFVLVDQYEIAGCGVIVEKLVADQSVLRGYVEQREIAWERSAIPDDVRTKRYGHKSKFILIVGPQSAASGPAVGAALERRLFENDFKAFCLSLTNLDRAMGSDLLDPFERREELVRRLGELARIMTDSGQIFISVFPGAETEDLRRLRSLVNPHEMIVVGVGSDAPASELDIALPGDGATEDAVARTLALLRDRDIIADYVI
jgi:bifunctional enzyme CysN/CysC